MANRKRHKKQHEYVWRETYAVLRETYVPLGVAKKAGEAIGPFLFFLAGGFTFFRGLNLRGLRLLGISKTAPENLAILNVQRMRQKIPSCTSKSVLRRRNTSLSILTNELSIN